MNNWEPYKLGDICTIKGGKRLPVGHELTSTVTKHPYIKARDIRNGKVATDNLEYISETTHNLISRYIVKANDVCITIVANIGDAGIIPFDLDNANLTENALRLTSFSKNVDPKFICYVLSSKTYKSYCESLAAGAAQAKLGIYKVKTINLFLPPLKEQQRIASILSAYDELIENNNKRITILEQMAEQIYKEWFVRMRFPGYENAEFEKGVPKGWLKELGNYIKVVKGKSYTGDEINEIGEGKPFVNLKSFNRGGGYRYDGIKFYTGKYHEKQVVSEGDIVMAVTDMTQDRAVVGRVARIPKTEFPEMIISLDSAKIVPDKKLPNAFFYATLRFGFFGNTIKEFANGSNVLHLKPDLAYQMKSIIPDDEELIKKFDKLIEPYFNLIDNLNLENQNLKKTRDLLLPRLISGKLRVKDLGAVTKNKMYKHA